MGTSAFILLEEPIMSNISRNDVCPCGSGRKYKRCCKNVDRTKAEKKAYAREKEMALKTRSSFSGWGLGEDGLTRDSNHVVALIREGRLDDAEAAGTKLLQEHPEVHDGFERLAMVFEARGDRARALEMYKKALDFVLDHGELYDEEMPRYFRTRITQLKNPESD
jgi:tetratricopeptide (TPR) repeat protein